MNLKFRAWDKENKTMLTWEQLKSEADFSWFADENLVFMQSTGLKDKSGVDIYEGDYLSLIVFEANSEYKGEVVFSEGSFCVVIRIKGHAYKVPLHEVTEGDYLMEVLGNIYENPELLEAAE